MEGYEEGINGVVPILSDALMPPRPLDQFSFEGMSGWRNYDA